MIDKNKELIRQNSIESYNQSQTIRISNNKISIYNGELTKIGLAKQLSRIAVLFPDLNDKNVLDILRERVKENNFTDRRLSDSVKYVIDHFKYITPNISDFIQYDKQVDIFSYREILEKLIKDQKIFSRVTAIDVGLSQPKYIWNNDFEEYGIFKKWEPEKQTPEHRIPEVPADPNLKADANAQIIVKSLAEKFDIKVNGKKIPIREQYHKPMTAEEIIAAAEKGDQHE